MGGGHELVRWGLVAVLLMMVVRSVDWMVNAPVDATASGYGLHVVTVLACGLTAYATWRPSEGARRVLRRMARRG